MTRVCLYNLHNPVLVVPAKTGVVYFNQTGGCACNQSQAEGYIVPLPQIDPMEWVAFNRHVWYEKGYMELPPKPAWRRRKIKMIEDPAKEWQSTSAQWWEQLVEEIEEMSRQTDWDGPQIKVDRTTPQQEAWLAVDWRFYYPNPWKRGILTWQNCD